MNNEQENAFRIAKEAAPFIDGNWRYHRLKSECHRQGWPTVTNDDQPGRAITFRAAWHARGRITIHGSLPGFFGSRDSTRDITVAPHRTGKSVAGDINRRLLPDYLKAWDERTAALAEDREAQARHAQKVRLLEPVLRNLRPRFGGTDIEGADEFLHELGSLKLWRNAGRADLTLEINYEDLIRVLYFLEAEGIGRGTL